MRAFACPTCSQLVFFENTACLNCGTELGFRWPTRELGALDGDARCANLETAACNWVPDRSGELCFSCRLTRTRPADEDEQGLAALRRAEAWTVLAPYEERRERCRGLFGDEREDYQAALDRHYAEGPPDDWQDRHVSAYATMHPAEDWAETFAHLLHLRDTLQTAAAYRVRAGGPDLPAGGAFAAAPQDDSAASFDELISDWLALTYALNAINRSMGRDDLYPFVLAPAVVEKLRLVHELMEAA